MSARISKNHQKIVDRAMRILEEALRYEGAAMGSPETTKKYLSCKLAGLEREVFGCLFLDSQRRVIESRELFSGTIDGASVYPREVVKACLEANAAAVILYHNHPSGVPEPSQADRAITRRLVDALALIDVQVLDHIVIGGTKSVSFSERGLL